VFELRRSLKREGGFAPSALAERAAVAQHGDQALAARMGAINAAASGLERRLAALPVDVGETERAFAAFEQALALVKRPGTP
jgi:hypothetical protein